MLSKMMWLINHDEKKKKRWMKDFSTAVEKRNERRHKEEPRAPPPPRTRREVRGDGGPRARARAVRASRVFPNSGRDGMGR